MGAEKAPLSAFLGIITLLKGMIGAGILNLPQAFSHVKLAIAVPGYLILSAFCAFSVYRLLQCGALAAEKLKAGDVTSDSEDAASLRSGSMYGLGPFEAVAVASFGHRAIQVVAVGVVGSQMGFCVAYIDVVVETLGQPSLLGNMMSPLSLQLALTGVLCLLSLIRGLGVIAKMSGVALAAYCYMLFALLRNGIPEMALRDHSEDWLPRDWHPTRVGGYIGTVLFAQEAIVIAQYVYEDMKLDSPEKFMPVLAGSFGACSLLCTFVGAFGYMAYGENIRNLFYMNFPEGSWDIYIAESILCFVLVITFVLQLYPIVCFFEAVGLGYGPAESFEELMDDAEDSQDSGGETARLSQSYTQQVLEHVGLRRTIGMRSTIIRWACVVFISAVGGLIPNLECVTGYSGAFFVSLIGFFLPAVCHMKLTGLQMSPLDLVLDVMLLCVGVAAVVLGVASSAC